MKFRFVVFGIVFLLGVWNAALVISDMPPCPINDDGTSGGKRGVPGWALCPHPDDYDCDIGREKWKKDGTLWIIWSDSRYDPFSKSPFGADYFRISFPGEYYMRDENLYPDAPYVVSVEVDRIVETDAVCFGRTYHPIEGVFRPNKSDNKNDLVMPGQESDCYRFNDCIWEYSDWISGWRVETVNKGLYYEYQRVVQDQRMNEMCMHSYEYSDEWPLPTVVACEDDDSEGTEL